MAREKPLPSGFLLATRHQTHGKGQRGNTWSASSGLNLTCSFLLNDHFMEVKNHFHLNMFVALAVADVLSHKFFVKNVSVKWPNDIYIGHLKVGGILIENQVKGALISQSIVGIGLNINQTDFSGINATSLTLCGYSNLTPELALNQLIPMLNFRYEQLLHEPEKLKVEYLNHLYLRNKLAAYKDKDGAFKGTIKGVDEYGKLLILDQENVMRSYQMKEVQLLGKV